MSLQFGRLLTAMVTPFHPDGMMDLDGAKRLANQLIEDGNDGLVICGTTGEAPTLSSQEKVQLWTAVREAVGPDIPIIAGTGSYCTRSTIELSKKAQDAGADGLLLVTPYYNKPSPEGMLAHFTAIHEATSIPIMLYNIPGRSVVEIPPSTLAELARLPRMAAVKQSLPIGPVGQLLKLLKESGDELLTYSGDDPQTLPQMSLGGVGLVSVAAHVAGPQIKSMLELFLAGKVQEAAELHLKLLPLFDVLFITANPAPVKYALELMGRPGGPVRLPLVDLNDGQRQQVRQVMESLGLIS